MCVYVVYRIPMVPLWMSLPSNLLEAESLVLHRCIHQASWPVRFWFFSFYLHRNTGIIDAYSCIHFIGCFWEFELWSSWLCGKDFTEPFPLSRVSLLRQTGLYLSVARSGLKYLEIPQLQPPQSWNFRYESPCPALIFHLKDTKS